jgi:hypothetical protein
VTVPGPTPQQAAAALGPLTDEQVHRVAALLNLVAGKDSPEPKVTPDLPTLGTDR